MDRLTVPELKDIEGRFDAFATWLERVIDGAGYDADAARNGVALVRKDMRRLIEQARERDGLLKE